MAASSSSSNDIFTAFYGPLERAVRARRLADKQQHEQQQSSVDLLDPENGLALSFESVLRAALVNQLDPDAPPLEEDERTALLQEAHTWSLLQALYTERTALPSTSKLADSYYTPPLTLVQHAVAASPALSELSVVRDWLQSCAAADVRPVEIRKGYHAHTRAKLKQSLRSGAQKHQESKLVTSLDPDATSRKHGNTDTRRMLEPEDANYDRAFVRSLYDHVRIGELDTAIDMCRQSDFAWRAASLNGGRLYNDETLASYARSQLSDGEMFGLQDANGDLLRNQNPARGNKRRKLWKKVCRSAAAAQHLEKYERALYAAVAGVIEPVLSVCSSWEDHVWARVNGLMESEIDAILDEEGRNGTNFFLSTYAIATDDSNDTASHKPKQSIPQALKAIFDTLLKDPVVANDARSPFHVAAAWLILDRASDLLTSFVSRLEKQQSAGTNPIAEPELAQLLRFFAHLVIFLRLVVQQAPSPDEGGRELAPPPEDAAGAILEAYVHVLQAHSAPPALIAFYSSALDPVQAVDCYSAYLASEFPAADTADGKPASDRAERKRALLLAEDNGIDLAAVAQRTVEITVADAHAELPDFDAASAAYGLQSASGSHPYTDRQQELVRSVEWLTFAPDTYKDALVHANATMRFFLCAGTPAAARRVVYHIPPDLLPVSAQQDAITTDEESANSDQVNEYLDYVSFFEALQLHNEFLEAWSQRPAPNARESERMQYAQALSKLLDALHTAIVDLLTAEWLVLPSLADYDVLDDVSKRRSIELSRIRSAYIPELVMRLHHALVDSGRELIPGNLQRALELSITIADERYRLYVEFMGDGHSASLSENSLREYLGLVRETSLLVLQQSNDPFQL